MWKIGYASEFHVSTHHNSTWSLCNDSCWFGRGKIQHFGVQFSSIFVITVQLYMFFTLTVLYTAANVMVHLYDVMKFSENQHNCQLSYPDHSGYHYVILQFNSQTFATCLYIIWDGLRHCFMSEKYACSSDFRN